MLMSKFLMKNNILIILIMTLGLYSSKSHSQSKVLIDEPIVEERVMDVSSIVSCLASSFTSDVCYMTAAKLSTALITPKMGYIASSPEKMSGIACELEDEARHSFVLRLSELLSGKVLLESSPVYYLGSILGHIFIFEKGVDSKGQYIKFIQSWGGRFLAKVWLDFSEKPVQASDRRYNYDLEKFEKARRHFGGNQKIRIDSKEFTYLMKVLSNMHINFDKNSAGEELFGVGKVLGNDLVPNYRKGTITMFTKKIEKASSLAVTSE